mmetsp:Transcript_87310/g.120281  ORF Transcript_87310/g.120281 Transcript_87310/m.120281 type:complete len:207 (-) Transcript_87310:8-628(-)
MRQISDHSQNIGSMNDFLLDGLAVLGHACSYYGVEHELFIIHEFNTSKGSNGAQEQFSCLVKVTDKHTVDTFENFELILFIPVSTILNELLALEHVFLNSINIKLFKVHKQDFEKNLHFLAGTTRHIVCLAEHFLGFNEISYLVFVEESLIQDSISDLNITFTFLGFLFTSIKLFEFFVNHFLGPLLGRASLSLLVTCHREIHFLG